MLAQVYLSASGVAYIVVVEDNNPTEIKQLLLLPQNGALVAEVLVSRRARNELLSVLKVRRRRVELA